MLKNLEDGPSNGLVGTLLSYRKRKNRWRVRLEGSWVGRDSLILSFRPCHLHLLPDTDSGPTAPQGADIAKPRERGALLGGAEGHIGLTPGVSPGTKGGIPGSVLTEAATVATPGATGGDKRQIEQDRSVLLPSTHTAAQPPSSELEAGRPPSSKPAGAGETAEEGIGDALGVSGLPPLPRREESGGADAAEESVGQERIGLRVSTHAQGVSRLPSPSHSAGDASFFSTDWVGLALEPVPAGDHAVEPAVRSDPPSTPPAPAEDQATVLAPEAAAVQATEEPAVWFDPTSTPPVPAGDQAAEPAVSLDLASTPPVPAKDQAADLAPDAAAVERPALASRGKPETKPRKELRPSPTLSLRHYPKPMSVLIPRHGNCCPNLGPAGGKGNHAAAAAGRRVHWCKELVTDTCAIPRVQGRDKPKLFCTRKEIRRWEGERDTCPAYLSYVQECRSAPKPGVLPPSFQA